MKEPNPNATIQLSVLDLGDGPDKVRLEELLAKADAVKPPPLPPATPARASAPAESAQAGGKRVPAIWFVALVLVAAVGIGFLLRGRVAGSAAVVATPSASATATLGAKPASSVIVVPTVEVGNE
ncbi:hypothetical protein AKJ09_05984 [Labilithrix luteola]|uniref:Uncharacterized protein n=2 Tax=Labilithrix luteola TaxID=1391654 RepID=A0A0K1Q0L7_9BACT|nr:hypothetical protein AKJ09_05984 [Labilithrix luteola]